MDGAVSGGDSTVSPVSATRCHRYVNRRMGQDVSVSRRQVFYSSGNGSGNITVTSAGHSPVSAVHK
jgi:hypothetical protein